MLEKIKLALRIKTKSFDEEILLYIDSCKIDLKRAGIVNFIETDNAIINTVIAYCKWQLNFQNQGKNWEQIYFGLKTALSLDLNYVH